MRHYYTQIPSMRKILSRIGIATLALLASNTAGAYDFKENGVYYNVVDRSAKTCAVTQNPDGYRGNVAIPEEVNGFKVIGIENDAFSYSAVDKVDFPTTLTYIGDAAFYSSSLTEAIIPNSVTRI